MISLRRIERRTEIHHAGTTVALVEANWFVLAGPNHRSAGFSYRSPGAVEVEGGPTIRIHDHVMLARLGAFAVAPALVLGALIRRRNT